MDFNDDPVLAEQEQMMMEKLKGKKNKTAKVHRDGQKFDSANHEKEKQEMAKQNRWSLTLTFISILIYPHFLALCRLSLSAPNNDN